MTAIKAILVLIEALTSILLVGIILLQKAKDEGLGQAFGTGVGETLFGSRAGNVLTKITIGLAVVFLVNTIAIGMLVSRTTPTSLLDRLPGERSAPVQQPAPAAESPLAPAGDMPAVPAPNPAGPVTPAPVAPAPVPVQ